MRKNSGILKRIANAILIIVGSFIVAFGAVVFLEPSSINSGGCSGIALIFETLTNDEATKLLIYNIVNTSFTIILWIVGLFLLGKEFALKTLIATIVYPLAIFIFSYCPGISYYLKELGQVCSEENSIGSLLLCGIFGGVCVGAGVAVTFIGGGSTGGVDVIVCILEKYAKLKSSLASFLVDGSIVVLGIIFMSKDHLPALLVGILSAFISAVLIESIYVGYNTSYQVDIISEKWEEISSYAQEQLGRGATIIRAEGGYKGDPKVILRVVFPKTQYNKLRDYLGKVDPKAFITFTETNAVYGEGFRNNEKPKVEHIIKPKKKKENNGKRP